MIALASILAEQLTEPYACMQSRRAVPCVGGAHVNSAVARCDLTTETGKYLQADRMDTECVALWPAVYTYNWAGQ
jgi:hypothetical protein